MNMKNRSFLGFLGIFLILSLILSCDLFVNEADTDEDNDDDDDKAHVEIPVITEAKLASRNYFLNSVAEPLSVTATVSEGTLSYQWYSITKEEETPISAATKNSYQPSTAEVSDTEYYVRITNTDETKEPPTAIVNSASARIIVGTVPDPKANITVDTATKYQKITGFGGMSGAWSSPSLTESDVDQLFSQEGFGFNILRVMIYPYMDNLFNGEEGAPPDDPDAHKRYYTTVKRAKSHGAIILASPWTPPAEMKEYNTRLGGEVDSEGKVIKEGDKVKNPNFLRKNQWGNYANHLKNYIKLMEDNEASIDYISIQNEPDQVVTYDGCVWTGDEMRDFVKQYAQTIIPAGSKVKLMPGEPNQFPNSYLNPIYTDADAMSKVDVIAGHIYGTSGESDSGRGLRRHATAINAGKEVWMTEHLYNNAADYTRDPQWRSVWNMITDVHKCMVADFNAYIWWYSKRFYSFIGDGYEYSGTIDGQLLFRGYALSHYAKYATGKTRVRATYAAYPSGSANTNVGVTAYESDDEITLVMYNNSTVTLGQVNINLPDGVAVSGATMVMTRGETITSVDNGLKMAPQPIILIRVEKEEEATFYMTGIIEVPTSCIISVRFTK